MRAETERLRQLLIEIDKKNSEECSLNVAAQWNFETNVNEGTQLDAVSVRAPFSRQYNKRHDIDLNMDMKKQCFIFLHASIQSLKSFSLSRRA